jgi:hypothetical protein
MSSCSEGQSSVRSVWVVITAKEVAHGCQEEDQESRQEGDEEKEEVTTVSFA